MPDEGEGLAVLRQRAAPRRCELVFAQTKDRDSFEIYAGRRQGSDGGHVVQRLNAGLSYGLCPNITRGVLAREQIRYALQRITDRRSLAEIALREGHQEATSVLTPPTWGYTQLAEEIAPNPHLAHTLLSQSGYERGTDGIYSSDEYGRLSFEVVFNSTFSSIDLDILTAVQAQWLRHGVELRIVDVDFSELTRRNTQGDYDFRFFYDTNTDPDVMRYQLAFSRRNKNCRLEPDGLDILLDAQISCRDPRRRRKIVEDIQLEVLRRGLWMPLYNYCAPVTYLPSAHFSLTIDAESLVRVHPCPEEERVPS
ncbi:hypothetical protein AWB85_15475 [Mycobacteroides immunogenum]|uniref:Solute-binding protein family 5 domain-containing protein n=1 Tax=Mycobacteroides immunogenum TaxID=83262 RepID=A0A179V548_9MYCO|nr:hypothetical protein AWB85_15475 [Mycobacteroides immunogenum]